MVLHSEYRSACQQVVQLQPLYLAPDPFGLHDPRNGAVFTVTRMKSRIPDCVTPGPDNVRSLSEMPRREELRARCKTARPGSFDKAERTVATRPTISKWRQTEPAVILCAVRWYLRYSLSLRDVEELLLERGLATAELHSKGNPYSKQFHNCCMRHVHLFHKQ